MGTLGQYLHNARVEKDIDLRDAAQQTRIGIQYLQALENDDFTKLPGEVFVKGFLKNYGRFLNLDEAEIMRRYAELKPQSAAPASSALPDAERPRVVAYPVGRNKIPVEPFLWGILILLPILIFLFTSLPVKYQVSTEHPPAPALPVVTSPSDTNGYVQPEKLYLELIALEDTWLLLRTDASPQKKAVLKKGENLIWSADERFLLSYTRVGSMKLVLNGQELVIDAPEESVVRDLAVFRNGIVNQTSAVKQQTPKHNAEPAQLHTVAREQKPSPGEHSAEPSMKPALNAPAYTTFPAPLLRP